VTRYDYSVVVKPTRGRHEEHALWAADDSLALTVGLGPVPSHSPYQAGDWVRCHGYPGALPGPRRWGWRGFVLGSMGSTLLRGLTDDGQPWAEHWGSLLPDRTPSPPGGASCTCCPHPQRFKAPRPKQLNLLDLMAGAR
jgi:hypothetical protein